MVLFVVVCRPSLPLFWALELRGIISLSQAGNSSLLRSLLLMDAFAAVAAAPASAVAAAVAAAAAVKRHLLPVRFIFAVAPIAPSC